MWCLCVCVCERLLSTYNTQILFNDSALVFHGKCSYITIENYKRVHNGDDDDHDDFNDDDDNINAIFN